MPKHKRARCDRLSWKKVVAKYLSKEQAAALKAEEEARNRKPHVFRYRRVSHEDSAESRLGLQEQENAINEWIDVLRRRKSIEEDAEVSELYSDEAVSAFRHNLRSRKEGKRLWLDAKDGDHVVFARIDRAFRNMPDMISTVAEWRKRGVHVHFADLGLDTDTAVGEFCLHILGAVAQFHSRYLSERSKSVANELKRQGRAASGRPRIGHKIVRQGKYKRLVMDPEQRAVMQLIVRMKDEEGLALRYMAPELDRRLKGTAQEGKWQRTRITSAYHREKEYQKQGI